MVEEAGFCHMISEYVGPESLCNLDGHWPPQPLIGFLVHDYIVRVCRESFSLTRQGQLTHMSETLVMTEMGLRVRICCIAIRGHQRLGDLRRLEIALGW